MKAFFTYLGLVAWSGWGIAGAISLTVWLVSLFVGRLNVPGWFGFLDPLSGESMDTNTAGMMAVVAGALFVLTMFAAPRHGLISKMLHQAALRLSIVREDVLGVLYRFEEWRQPERPPPDAALVQQVIGIGPMTPTNRNHVLPTERDCKKDCFLTRGL